MKTNVKKNSEVMDIGIDTLVSPDDFGRMKDSGPGAPASREEVEEGTVLINPDEDSMESRG